MPTAVAANRKPAPSPANGTISASHPTTRPLGTHSARYTGRSTGDPRSSRLTARLRRTAGPLARGGWSAMPRRTRTSTTRHVAAAPRKSWLVVKVSRSRPPRPYPTICITPTAMLIVARAKTKDPSGTISETSAIMLPPVAESSTQGTTSSTRRAVIGRSGIAWAASPAAIRPAETIIAVRGRHRSASESRNHDVASRTSGPPNITKAARSGEPVSSYVRVPSARLPTEPAATFSDVVVNRTRNSRIPNSSR